VALKPGVGHALDFCRRHGARLALASSSPRRLIDVVVHGAGLDNRFSVLRSAEDEEAGKPDPAIFLTTAKLLGVEPGRCVVFEDSAAGVTAAKAAGMACVAVPEAPVSEGGRPEPGATVALARADVVLRSLEELDDEVWARCAAALGAPSPGTAAPGTAAPGTAAPGTAAPGTAAPGTTGGSIPKKAPPAG
jgi:beta-phosphoglucomutase-like phosphatase (HAD superfamily)